MKMLPYYSSFDQEMMVVWARALGGKMRKVSGKDIDKR